MFTGLVERCGNVVGLLRQTAKISVLEINPGADFAAALGDSVAVNGCCLTVKSISGTTASPNRLYFDVSSETLAVTALPTFQKDTLVNLERAMRLGDRLGGHLVAGHVDGIAEVIAVDKAAEGWLVKLRLPGGVGIVIPKGSLCVDGVSLTVNRVDSNGGILAVDLMIIPHTLAVTTLRNLATGQKVNFEVDMVGKFVQGLAGVYLR